METVEKSTRSLKTEEKEKLMAAAKQAAEKARCPYSHFGVGAALLLTDGTIVTGFNIESPAFSMTVCAERCAIFTAIATCDIHSEDVLGMAVYGSTDEPISPCGACRQVIFDNFGNDLPMLLGSRSGKVLECTPLDLLYHPFVKGDME